MPVEAPDPKTFKSWEDAFQYAAPAVRRMEQQLRTEISGNRERLRTLVGASYRDLLGTAESIVDMNSQIGLVETNLSDVGKRCNTTLLERSGANLLVLGESTGSRGRDRLAFASHYALLQTCPEVITRLLRDRGPVLLAAKVLVFSRLLHKKVSSHPLSTEYCDTIRVRLVTLRRKLLSRIDSRLTNLRIAKDGLLDAMCAYSLATSSSAADVLRHFHQIRGEIMAFPTRIGYGVQSNFLWVVRCWVQTLQDTQAVFPRLLAITLARLKTSSIFDDPAVQSVDEFDFGIRAKWVGDDIRHFVPYIIHDNLQPTPTASLLAAWAVKTFQDFLTTSRGLLNTFASPGDVEILRRECFVLLLSNYDHIIGVNKTEVLDGLREAFLGRLRAIVHIRCGKLEEVTSTIAASLQNWSSAASTPPQTLWDGPIGGAAKGSGGQLFNSLLEDSLYGSSSHVLAVAISYRRWHSGIEDAESVIKRLGDTRWMDDLFDFEDDDDLGSSKHASFGEEDSRTLGEVLNQSLLTSFEGMQASLSRMTDSMKCDADSGYKVAFLLRVLREIRRCLPSACARLDLGCTLINELHSSLSNSVINSITAGREMLRNTLAAQSKVPSRALWTGSPQLPILPSPWVVQLLRNHHQAMAARGADLWSPAAVKTLKRSLRASLAADLETSSGNQPEVNGSEGGDSVPPMPNGTDSLSKITIGKNGEGGEAETLGQQHDFKVQLLFNVAYIDAITSAADQPVMDDIYTFRRRIERESHLAETSIETVGKNAVEYWKRTSMLFALLA